MTRDAGIRPPENELPGSRVQDADADMDGGEEPPLRETCQRPARLGNGWT